jgi:phage/plasmid-like protein (TIGR03299 family)
MSRETIEWLNTMTRIGDTDKRGKAWHWREGNNNHFPGAVPVEEVKRLILPFEPIETPNYITVPATAEEYARFEDGGHVNGTVLRKGDGYVRLVQLEQYKAIVATDKPEHVYSVPSGEYTIHGYEQWLVKHVQNLLDEDVHISSAGLLEGGAVAWVELAISETQTVADFPYRPHLLASTSVNGKYKTKFGRKIQAVVCDNTLHIADSESGQDMAFKHTKGSLPRIADSRTALGLIVATGKEFKTEMESLLDFKVPSKLFSKWLDLAVPFVDEKGEPLGKTALTVRENKRQELAGMWRNDDRVSPWSGTAFGVLQLNNTFYHHNRGLKGDTVRQERNMLSAISGDTARNDLNTLTLLKKASDLLSV